MWKIYFNNNELKLEVNFKNGKRNGLWREYYENGQLYGNGKFINGLMITETCFNKVGEKRYFKKYYITGEKLLEINYENNQIISKKCWDKNGNEIECK